MDLIGQEMSEILDFDGRCAKKSIPKVITSSLMIQQIRINNLCQQIVNKVPKIHTLSQVK
jgi:hypothetical protein